MMLNEKRIYMNKINVGTEGGKDGEKEKEGMFEV